MSAKVSVKQKFAGLIATAAVSCVFFFSVLYFNQAVPPFNLKEPIKTSFILPETKIAYAGENLLYNPDILGGFKQLADIAGVSPLVPPVPGLKTPDMPKPNKIAVIGVLAPNCAIVTDGQTTATVRTAQRSEFGYIDGITADGVTIDGKFYGYERN